MRVEGKTAALPFRALAYKDYLLITPNTIVIAYYRNDEGIRPKTDVYLRITFLFDIEP